MNNLLEVEDDGRKGGIALLWPRNLEVSVKSYFSHNIEAVIEESTASPWRLVGFYGHHEVSKRRLSWELLRHIDGLSQLLTLVIGDFNEVLLSCEHVSQRHPRPHCQMYKFNQVVQDCGMVDLGYNRYPLTWCNKFISPHSTRANLDKALASKDWRSQFSEVTLYHISTYHSDHLSIWLKLGNQSRGIPIPKSRFRFEANWCLYEDSKAVRAKAEWHLKGYYNTNYFHALTVIRGKQNKILALQDEQGVWYHFMQEIHNLVVDFYKKLFGMQTRGLTPLIGHLITPSMERTCLDMLFTEEDVKFSVFSMNGTKAPGPDGMSALFYQHYWETVGPDLCKMVL
ncbi:hypothetical protein LIER_39116 [Lithospermum erythrorhizon]|uniref:Reverse transcriptase n=1 Tax=Lithospermum erythrorhizon TaxID=34254 RepID=A0AAV3QF90_LITER